MCIKENGIKNKIKNLKLCKTINKTINMKQKKDLFVINFFGL